MLDMLGFADRLEFRPRHILVTGVSGAGKTTLAARIAAGVDAPHTEAWLSGPLARTAGTDE